MKPYMEELGKNGYQTLTWSLCSLMHYEIGLESHRENMSHHPVGKALGRNHLPGTQRSVETPSLAPEDASIKG